MSVSAACDWASEEFGRAELGDRRRTRRLVRMAATAMQRPAGRILEVFQTSAERQGAYDLLANGEVRHGPMTESLGSATAARCIDESGVYVSIDGSSLSLTDHTGRKGFGGVGSTQQGGRGLKVVTALAVDMAGTPVGVLDQQWWARRVQKKCHAHRRRAVHDTETQHWVDCIRESQRRMAEHAPRTRLWFLLDRENDRRGCLEALHVSGETFVVRSSTNRRLVADDRRYLLEQLDEAMPSHGYVLHVTAGPGRSARKAHMLVRAVHANLRLSDRGNRRASLGVTVVEAREAGTTPPGEKPIAWRLLTNHPVCEAADADRVIEAYARRWSIEPFHKTWKTGACNVEDSQLRDRDHVVKWAILMAAVAARIERLKVLSRQQPDQLADSELTKYEIAALILLKRKFKKRTETIPDSVPTLRDAVTWIAELGGYTGKSSGGPPGSITIRRGLDYLAPAAATIRALEKQGKLR